LASASPGVSVPAADGTLWFGHNLSIFGPEMVTGVSRFEGRQFNSFPEIQPVPVHGTLAQTADGALWLPGREEGVIRFDGSSFVRSTPETVMTDGLARLDVFALAAAPDGSVWAGSMVWRGLAKESSVWLIAPLDSNERPSLVESAPCFVLHGGTATSDAREMLLRAPVRPTPGLARDEPVLDPSVVPGMREWRLDRIRGTATERQLTHDPCDFPVELEDDLIVALAGEGDGGPDYTRCRGVARVGPGGELDRRLHPRGSFGGEFRPVMTDDGMVLAGLITWPDASELLILDPSDLSAEPLARVHVPVAIAAGLHSAWLPGE